MRVFLTILIFVLFTGCGVKVHTLHDPTVDFSKYKNFCWMQGCEFTFTGPAYLNTPEVKEKIQQAVVAEMAAKGILLDPERADLLLDVRVTIEDEVISASQRQEQPELYQRLFEGNNEIHLLKGTLVIDMADKREARMVWRSVAVSYLDTYPELTQKNLQRGVRLVLKKFPPKKQH